MMLRACLLLLATLSLQAQGLKALAAKLEAKGVKVSGGLWDLPSGRLLEAHKPDQALIPASTTKVVSTYAMLKTWKPHYTFETEIWGNLQGGVVKGDLVLKGGGDPFLTSERLWMMAQDLKSRGITRVQGRIRFDQSGFDAQRFHSAWEGTSSNVLPPILPLSVNFNRDEAGVILKDPERVGVETVTRIFRESGIAVEGAALNGNGIQKIGGFGSLPLRDLTGNINKFSNNFMVEMLVKRFGEGRWPQGIARIQTFYKDVLQLNPDKVGLSDGSGLSKDNRLSARTLAIILRAAWHDFEVGPEFVESLKVIGGEPWKLKVKDENLARRIRCKTGHLTQVESVCGYLQAPDGKLRVFALILNGPVGDAELWKQVSDWAN